VFGCSLSYSACKTHVPYYIVACCLFGFTTFFPRYLINGTIFRKRLLNIDCVFYFLYNLFEIILSLRLIYRAIVIHAYRYSLKNTRYSCQIVMELEFSRRIFEKCWDIKCYENRAVRAELFHADGQTEVTKPIIVFWNFGNAPKNLKTVLLYATKARWGSRGTALLWL
jgi:hypothetical protein